MILYLLFMIICVIGSVSAYIKLQKSKSFRVRNDCQYTMLNIVVVVIILHALLFFF